MRRWSHRFVALALLWTLMPGAMEAIENFAHMLSSGHLAHSAESGDSHSDPGPEHGCNGTFHLCSCHVAPTGLLTAVVATTAAELADPLSARLTEPPTSAHLHNIEHPPQSSV